VSEDDKFRPTNVTAEGQMISFAGGLRNAGRAGKVLAILVLLGMLAVGVFLAVTVFSL
jgi:hypothetical protein